MYRFALYFVCAVFSLWAAPALAEPVAVDSPRWSFLAGEGAESRVEDFQGRKSLWLKGSIAVLEDARFETGVIEFDMATTNTYGFPAVLFRGGDDSDYEHFYLRTHQSGWDDATQYTPVFHGMTGWQIYGGAAYEAKVAFPERQWFHVKLEIAEDSARIYVNSDSPTLVVGDLKRDRRAGWIALKGSVSGAHFANIVITPGQPAAAPPEPAFDLPAGLVRTWRLSAPMAEAEAVKAAEDNRLDRLVWTSLPVETNGIANLARKAAATDGTPTMLTRVTVRSNAARTVPMRFGFSDRVRVYVNGRLLYEGDETQGSHEPRFLGIVGFWSTLQVPLNKGDNEVVFAVSEKGGGWAAAAAFPQSEGLTILGD